MNALSNHNEDVAECPLCMEPLEVDDLNFYPCTCGYQICRFCWHRIRTDENELCPACRKEYPENPADFTPLTQEQMIAFKSQKRQRDQQRKHKITENRKHLANVRVVQKNLVFVVGLPPRLADADILKRHEYFGKYGKMHKVVINPSTTYAGVQGPSASAYVTYVNNSDSLRAIQSVNNIMIDGRLIKTSLGTTKYCSHFMKNQQCPKSDCMYLHELGDPEASFTKEEMHQGKHQEYEKRLHDALIAISGLSTSEGICNSSTANGTAVSLVSGVAIPNNNKNDNCKITSNSSLTPISSSSSSSASGSSTNQKEAWPSLSTSPINTKESVVKNKKEKAKHEKSKNEKSVKTKNHRSSSNHNANSSSLLNKDNENPNGAICRELSMVSQEALRAIEALTQDNITVAIGKSKSKTKENKGKYPTDKSLYSKEQQEHLTKENKMKNLDNEVNFGEYLEKQQQIDAESETECRTRIKISKKNQNSESVPKSTEQRSLSSSSEISDSIRSCNSDDISVISDSTSGKSSPSRSDTSVRLEKITPTTKSELEMTNEISENDFENCINKIYSKQASTELEKSSSNNTSLRNITEMTSVDMSTPTKSTSDIQLMNEISNSNDGVDTTAALSKLNLFDDNNSFFSSLSTNPLQQSFLLRNKLQTEMRQNQINGLVPSQLPDLLSGIDGNQKITANSNEWEEAFKNVMARNNKNWEEQIQQQQLHQQHLQQQQLHQHQQIHHQEDLLRIKELQKRNNLLNSSTLSQVSNDYLSMANHNGGDLSCLSQAALMQQHLLHQQQAMHSNDATGNGLIGTNMSKFFDFHKNQQQQMHQQFLMGGQTLSGVNCPLSDDMRSSLLIENNRINPNISETQNGLIIQDSQQQQQLQKQMLLGKCELMQQPQQPLLNQHHTMPHQRQTHQPPQQNRLPNKVAQNTTVDDELDFDPFIETQKALAELMENEVVQQHNTKNTVNESKKNLQKQQQQQFTEQKLLDNMQRARMPPPGFNHMNAFGFGAPRPQQSSSKILPYVNNSGQQPMMQQQQQQVQMPSLWNSHLASYNQNQNQQSLNQQMHQININVANNSNGFSTNDWTTMDPAILSFRQFSSYSQQPQVSQHPQQQDNFLQHMPQQQQMNNGQVFGYQAQARGGLNIHNTQLNSQQAAQLQNENWLPVDLIENQHM